MELVKNKNGNTLEVVLKGKLDAIPSPQLEKIVFGELDGVEIFTVERL